VSGFQETKLDYRQASIFNAECRRFTGHTEWGGIFYTIDLGNTYYQVELSKDLHEKMTFSTKAGQYSFTQMPYGIAAAPGTLQEMMTKVFGNLKESLVYLDHILLYSKGKKSVREDRKSGSESQL